MLDNYLKLVAWLWSKGRYWRKSALVALALLALGIAEAAQSNLLGEAPMRVAARWLPWQPVLGERASLTGSYVMSNFANADEPLVLGADCPPGSIITFTYERSRSGWVAAIGLTEPFMELEAPPQSYSLSGDGMRAVPISGKTRYTAQFTITSADGLEVFAIVGADKPFSPEDNVIPALRRLSLPPQKGGTPVLAGYGLAWTDAPVIGACRSR